MKSMEKVHNIPFDDVPATLVKLNGNIVRARSFVRSQRETYKLEPTN
jgi:hypothetical protein